MTQMNLSTIQKHTQGHWEQTCGCQGWKGEEMGGIGSLKLVDANYYIYDV